MLVSLLENIYMNFKIYYWSNFHVHNRQLMVWTRIRLVNKPNLIWVKLKRTYLPDWLIKIVTGKCHFSKEERKERFLFFNFIFIPDKT